MIKNLKRIYIFEGFGDDFLNDILNNSIQKNFNQGEYVIHEGDISENAYVILDGIVSVIKDGKNINTIFSGDIFGEISLVTNEKRTASILAETNLKVLEFNKETLIRLINNYPNGDVIKATILNRIIQNNKLK